MTAKVRSPRPPIDDALERSIRDIDIPPRPVIIDRIREEMEKKAPNLKLVGQQICADVGLAAGLLQLANSSYFGLRNRARSVHEALLMLGLKAASHAVAAISLRRAFPDSARYERFWESSGQIAALSDWLAHSLIKLRIRPTDAYTYGLFRDCGIVILLRRFTQYFATLDAANRETERAFTAVERERLPVDHSIVGYLLATTWWLPEEVCLAVRHHHDYPLLDQPDSSLPVASRHLIAIAQTAEHILQNVTGLSHTEEWTKCGPLCLRILGVEEGDLPALYQRGGEVIKSSPANS